METSHHHQDLPALQFHHLRTQFTRNRRQFGLQLGQYFVMLLLLFSRLGLLKRKISSLWATWARCSSSRNCAIDYLLNYNITSQPKCQHINLLLLSVGKSAKISMYIRYIIDQFVYYLLASRRIPLRILQSSCTRVCHLLLYTDLHFGMD